jgi:ribosomal protein S27E
MNCPICQKPTIIIENENEYVECINCGEFI